MLVALIIAHISGNQVSVQNYAFVPGNSSLQVYELLKLELESTDSKATQHTGNTNP